MAGQRKNREAWIAAASELLGEGGIDAVRVEPLARSLGVTKGSFYWHFTDRSALLDSILDFWESIGTEAVIDQVEGGGGGAMTRARRLWKVTSADPLMSAELGIRDWARRDPDVAGRVQRVDDRRMAYLRMLLGELAADRGDVEAAAMLLYSLLIGNYFIVAKHGRRSRRRVLDDAVDLILESIAAD